MSHEQETRSVKLEIVYLRKKLRFREYVGEDPMPLSSEGSDEDRDLTYKQRSRTPPIEFFSASLRLDTLERHGRRQGENPSLRNMGNGR